MPLIDCPQKLVYRIPDCFNELTFNLGLEPNEKYIINAFRNNARLLKIEVTTDLTGSFTLDSAQRDNLNSLFSPMQFEFYKDGDCKRSQINLCGETAETLILEFYTYTGDINEDLIIPCC